MHRFSKIKSFQIMMYLGHGRCGCTCLENFDGSKIEETC